MFPRTAPLNGKRAGRSEVNLTQAVKQQQPVNQIQRDHDQTTRYDGEWWWWCLSVCLPVYVVVAMGSEIHVCAKLSCVLQSRLHNCRPAGWPGMVQVPRLSLWGARISFQFLAHCRVACGYDTKWELTTCQRCTVIHLEPDAINSILFMCQFTDICLVSLFGRPGGCSLDLPIFADWIG